MKKIITALLLIAALFSIDQRASAQVNVSVNIGSQPLWGPVGYDVVEYYYLPDVEAYYYVPSKQFVYLSGGNWIFATSLPARYRSYNLYRGYKVVINEPRPYLHFANHKVKYAKFKGTRGSQVVIRDSRDPKYYVVKGHPGNSYKYKSGSKSGGKENGKSKENGNGKGNGHGNGKGKHK